MPRETLTREQIVQAAIGLLDAEGLDGLSMRSLGTRLNSAPTAMYWHVKNKDDLVVLAGDHVFGEIALPEIDSVGWRAAATAMARDTYQMVSRHSWLVPAMSTHLIYGPNKARHDDHGLGVYEAAGFTGMDADAALATVFVFVLGRALGEAAEAAWRQRLARDGDDEQERMRDVMAEVTKVASRFPRLRARIDAAADHDLTELPDESFDFGLHTILDGLERRLRPRRQGH